MRTCTAVIVLTGISTAVTEAGSVAEMTHVLIWHTCIVLSAECSWDATLAEVLGRRSDGITAVAAYPAVGQEVRHWYNPTSSCIDACVAGVLT